MANLKDFMDHANQLSFVYPQKSFEHFMVNLKNFEEKTPPHLQKAGLSDALALDLNHLVNPIAEIIVKEARQRQTIVLDSGFVSDRLKNLPTQLVLTDSQNYLLQETVRCLECGIYRSTAVMGWNLAYDYIRQWAFNNHLADFNTELTSILNKKGQPVFDPINDFTDFMKSDAPSERTVLDILLAANKIGGNPHEDLKKHLRQRNHYAHPSDRVPTHHQVNSYIEDLIDIITRPPFK